MFVGVNVPAVKPKEAASIVIGAVLKSSLRSISYKSIFPSAG